MSACGPRRPTPRAAARTCACSPVPFARAVDALCTAEEPAAADRVVPLSPHQVNCRVQVLADVIGLEGVSSHSGRRGLASELVRRGASTTAVQLAGGWRSASMVARYASAVAVEDGAVARLFGGKGGSKFGGQRGGPAWS